MLSFPSLFGRDKNKLLLKAAEDGDKDKVRQLLDKGANIETRDEDGETPLLRSCQLGRVEVVKMLLNKGANIEARGRDGSTSLHFACNRPLHLACHWEKGHVEIVKMLLAKGANIEATDKAGKTPLHGACLWGHVEIIEMLLARGANIEAMDKAGIPLCYLDGSNPLHWACGNGHVEVAEMLLARGADINATDICAWTGECRGTPMHWACHRGHVEVAKMLLDKGANIDPTDESGWTPLHRACQCGHVEVVELLLANGGLTSDPTTKFLRMLVGRGCDEEEVGKRIYRTLKLLVGGMEREEIRHKMAKQHDKLADGADHMDTGTVDGTTNNTIADEAVYVEPDAASSNVGEMALSDASYKVTEGASTETEIKARSKTTFQEIFPSESSSAAAMRELAVKGNKQTTFSNQTIKNGNTTRHNILHSACHLSKGSCPPDGSLISFLASEKASQLEYGKESAMKLAEEKDEVGNHALHIFLSNESYASPMENGDGNDARRSNHSHQSVEYQIVKALIASHPSSISTPNDDYNLPLKLAMQSGLRNVIALLVVEYPEAVLMDPSLENIKIFSEVLISISLSLKNRSSTNVNEEAVVDGEVPEESKMLSAVFYLIRSRPDVVESGGAALSSVASSVKGKSDMSPTLFRMVMK